MKAKYISYQDTHSFPALVIDYINNKDALKPLYSFRPDFEGLAQALSQHQFKGNRQVLADVLQKQYRNITLHPAVANNLKILKQEHTFTVTTGHQLNLFTGPLYFIYKIVSTINLALELKQKHPDKDFVPVYWMATEDHDFEEINQVNIEDSHISWVQQSNGATGRLSTENVRAAVQAYQAYLGISPNGKKLAALVEKAYLGHNNLADATRELTNSLFEQYGLVIIDADDHQLKNIFAPIIRQDIIAQHSSHLTAQRNTQLLAMGYKPQVHAREINFFYLKADLRERIIEENGSFRVNHTNIQFSKTELIAEIEQYPERFSPNVVMRPLYQELILPNIAYIGGGAEVSYWMQLKSVFDHYQLSFPVLLLRNSALVIDERSQKNIHRLGLEFEDLFLPLAQLQSKWVNKHSENKLNLNDERALINSIFDRIKLNAYKVDKTLEAAAEASQTKTMKHLAHLENKLIKAEKRNQQTAIEQLENLKKRLFPGGALQERIHNIAPMYVNYGDDFIASLIEGFEPLGGDFTLIIA